MKFTYEGNDYMIADNGRGYEYHPGCDYHHPFVMVERTDHVHRMWKLYLAEKDAEWNEYLDEKQTEDDFLAMTGRM